MALATGRSRSKPAASAVPLTKLWELVARAEPWVRSKAFFDPMILLSCEPTLVTCRSAIRQPISRRSAFTLLELLLTLAVLAATAAVVIPQLGWLIGDRRLMRAADQLRVEMTRLRVKAMREGTVMIMEGALEEGSFRIRPHDSVSDSTESMDVAAPSALLSGAKQELAAPALQVVSEPRQVELPENVVIAGVSVISAVRSMAVEQETMGEQSQGWSRPILFYPDGTTSTAVVNLRHETMGSISVRLRGITGDATVGEVNP